MTSGRRETVLIFCASPVKELYLGPMDHYDPDRAYVFLSDRKDNLSEVERTVYRSCVHDMPCNSIMECPVDTHDFEAVLGTIIEIKNELEEEFGDDADVFINITSGTHEFAAAGMFASMLPKRAIAFRVEMTDCGFSKEEILGMISNTDGKMRFSEPSRVSVIENKDPDEEMLVFLSVLDMILSETKYPKYERMIEELKKRDSWSYDPDRKSGRGRTSLEQREEMYLKRHYLTVALENGWVEKPSANTMRMTESGKAYLSVFNRKQRSASLLDHGVLYRCSFAHRSPGTSNRCEKRCFEPSFSDEISVPIETSKKNIIEFKRGRKTYRFRVDMEQHR